MAEYRSAIFRNALLATIGIVLIISVAIFGSTVLTKTSSTSVQSTTIPHSTLTSGGNSTVSSSLSSMATVTQPFTTLATSSSKVTTSSTSSSSMQTTSTITTSSFDSTSDTSSPATQVTPPNTKAEISFSASQFAFDNRSNAIYAISNNLPGTGILEINGTNNQVIGEISLPSDADADSIVFNPANNELYFVLSYNERSSPHSSLIAINPDTNTIVMNYTGASIGGLAVDPIHNLVYGATVQRSANSTVSLGVAIFNGSTDQNTGNRTIYTVPSVVGGGCCFVESFIYNPVTSYIYESDASYGVDGGFSPFILAYNLRTNATNVSAQILSSPNGPANFAYNEDNGFTYVSSSGYTSPMGADNPPFVVAGDNITVLLGSTYISTIRVSNPGQNGTVGSIVYDQVNNRIIVANGTLDPRNYTFVNQNVTVLGASGTVTEVIPVAAGGIYALFYDSLNEDLYVATLNTIFVINLGS
jgi:hypothetical protein